MKPMRNCVLIEPIIDIVETSNIVSSFSSIFEADLQTITLEELNFVSSFRMQISRKDLMHGIVGWFEVKFLQYWRAYIKSTPYYFLFLPFRFLVSNFFMALSKSSSACSNRFLSPVLYFSNSAKANASAAS